MTDCDEPARSRLELTTDETNAQFALIAVSGELDLDSAPRLREAALDLLRRGVHRLVIDLTGLRFLDSVGLGVLMLVLKRLEAVDGDLALVCEKGDVMRVFEVSGLTDVFRIAPTLGDASRAASRPD